MESDAFVSVCDGSSGQPQVFIVDLKNGNQVMKRPMSAEAAIMNPVSKILALRAKILETGFMIAASADIGRFMTWLPFLRSTIKTWGWPDEPSQTLTKASDSMAQDCVRKRGVGVPWPRAGGFFRRRRLSRSVGAARAEGVSRRLDAKPCGRVAGRGFRARARVF